MSFAHLRTLRSTSAGFPSLLAGLWWSLLLTSPVAAVTPTARTAIERAVRQIELGDLELARSYLALPLIDPRITVTERSRAYYLKGFSLEQQNYYVSAAQNYAKALAFNSENPATLAALGNLYARGLGVSRDRQQAEGLLRRSAEHGHGPGMTGLGALLLTGLPESHSPEQDLVDARAWLESAARADDGEALLFLARSFRAGSTDDPDPEQALKHYEEALLLNQAAAFNHIGHMQLNGELGKVDTAAAIAAFERGAQMNEPDAQISLGYLYLLGNGVSQDIDQARSLFSKAATTNNPLAHHYLGYMAETTDDLEGAQHHYRLAARGQHLPALKRLSELSFYNDQPANGIRYLQTLVQKGQEQNHADPTQKSGQQRAIQQAANQLGWLLATHDNADLRNADAALSYAQLAVAGERSSATLDTLAAAYAEANDFEQAVELQTEAIRLLNGPEQRSYGTGYANRLTSQHVALRIAFG